MTSYEIGYVDYEVDEILGVRKIKEERCYLVKWKGGGLAECSWVAEKSLSCPDVLERFKKNPPKLSKEEEKLSEWAYISPFGKGFIPKEITGRTLHPKHGKCYIVSWDLKFRKGLSKEYCKNPPSSTLVREFEVREHCPRTYIKYLEKEFLKALGEKKK